MPHPNQSVGEKIALNLAPATLVVNNKNTPVAGLPRCFLLLRELV